MSEPPGAVADDRSHRWWLLALLGFSFLCRAALGSFYFGFHTGDDVEILEFGFHRALGLAYTPWAIRNTLLSDVLVAPVVWLAHAAGTELTRRLCWFATAPFVLLSVLNVKMLHALVLRWFRDPVLSLAAAAAYALHWIPMGYGSTVYPRTASTACVLASVLLLARERTSWLRYAVAGFLLSIGFAFRYSEGIYLVPVLILLAWRGEEPRLRGIALVCSGFALGVLVFCGGYDLLLWGRAFSSLRAFWTYTLVERASSSLSAVQPPYWYLWRSLRWISPTALPFLYFAFRRGSWRKPALFAFVPLLLLSAIHHKELRYLQGVIPFLSVLVAMGALELWRRGHTVVTAALVISTVIWCVLHLNFLRLKSMAAALTAEEVARDTRLHSFAATQAWAFGDRLYFANGVAVRDIPYPGTRAADLDRLTRGADRVALYEKVLSADPSLADTMSRNGFCLRERVVWGQSQPVLLYAPCAQASAARSPAIFDQVLRLAPRFPSLPVDGPIFGLAEVETDGGRARSALEGLDPDVSGGLPPSGGRRPGRAPGGGEPRPRAGRGVSRPAPRGRAADGPGRQRDDPRGRGASPARRDRAVLPADDSAAALALQLRGNVSRIGRRRGRRDSRRCSPPEAARRLR